MSEDPRQGPSGLMKQLPQDRDWAWGVGVGGFLRMFISWQSKWVLLFEFVQSDKPSFSLAFLQFVQHFIH